MTFISEYTIFKDGITIKIKINIGIIVQMLIQLNDLEIKIG